MHQGKSESLMRCGQVPHIGENSWSVWLISPASTG